MNENIRPTDLPDDRSNQSVEIAGGGRFPIALEGLPFIAIGALAGALSFIYISPLLSTLPFAFSLFSAWFFRNPTRTPPKDQNLVISPADGRICQIADIQRAPHLGTPARRVSIFMGVMNVHINRSPIEGTIIKNEYHPGKFFNASLDKASEQNERNELVIEAVNGAKILFVQIAGTVARRIVCYAKLGTLLKAGQRFGLIRFGSRVDVYFPANSELLVKVGDRVSSGESILGKLTGARP